MHGVAPGTWLLGLASSLSELMYQEVTCPNLDNGGMHGRIHVCDGLGGGKRAKPPVVDMS